MNSEHSGDEAGSSGMCAAMLPRACDMHHPTFSRWCGHCLDVNGYSDPNDAPSWQIALDAMEQEVRESGQEAERKAAWTKALEEVTIATFNYARSYMLDEADGTELTGCTDDQHAKAKRVIEALKDAGFEL